MFALSKDELKDFIRNEMDTEGLARRYVYDRLRNQGISHKEALARTIESINELHSPRMDEEQLRILKQAIFKAPGAIS